MITSRDDYLHEVGPERNFNESMYFQFSDATTGVGGFVRLANRPNEGRGERTVCLFLPDGAVAFTFSRPDVFEYRFLNAAGLAFDVVEPFARLRTTFSGSINVLSDPGALIDPKRALSTSPVVDCDLRLDFEASAPPFAETFDGDGESFAPNHYEQLMTVSGVLVIRATSYKITGFGLRDHSWGPRSWQAPWFYRWVHGSTAGLGFMAAYFGSPDGNDRRGGFVWDGTELQKCDDVTIVTGRDDEYRTRSVQATLTAGERRWSFTGETGAVVPLRNRTDGGHTVTRILEAPTAWISEEERLRVAGRIREQFRKRLRLRRCSRKRGRSRRMIPRRGDRSCHRGVFRLI